MTQKKPHIPIHPLHHALSFSVFIGILALLFFLSIFAYPYAIVSKAPEPNESKGQSESKLSTSKILAQQSVEALAPFVRGVIDGSKTSLFFSEELYRPLAINKVEGYKNGAKTAILTSLNWYDLDRELFASSGLIQGVENAVAQSKLHPLQFQLGYQIQLIDKLRSALSTNLEDLLNQAGDRRVTFLQYLGELKVLLEESRIELAQLSRELSRFKADWESALNRQDTASETFKLQLRQSMVEDIESSIKEFETSGSEAVRLRAQHNAYLSVFKNLEPLASRLPQVIAALEANAEALIAGIKITPTPGVNLPLFRQ